MKQIIINKLKEIEEKYDVIILYAIESGSRAWGFASKDSDYDVRFIYAHKKEYYLQLQQTRDVIEYQLDDVFDINGWDITKALKLLAKSNPTLLEWCFSPIVYKTTPIIEELKTDLVPLYFSKKKCLYHYLSMAKTSYHGNLEKDMVNIKKYFYVLRALLACKWILDKNQVPPVLFSDLLAYLDTDIKDIVNVLLEKKKQALESDLEPINIELKNYINKAMINIEKQIISLPKEEKIGWEPLNSYFLKVL